VLARIPVLRPDTAILDARLMLTSYSDDDMLFGAIMAGAAGYLLKQVTGGDPVSAVRPLATGGSPLDRGSVARCSWVRVTPHIQITWHRPWVNMGHAEVPDPEALVPHRAGPRPSPGTAFPPGLASNIGLMAVFSTGVGHAVRQLGRVHGPAGQAVRGQVELE
jgi:hypothetical protein